MIGGKIVSQNHLSHVFRPAGARRFAFAHSLRCGLHSYAALRLKSSTAFPLRHQSFAYRVTCRAIWIPPLRRSSLVSPTAAVSPLSFVAALTSPRSVRAIAMCSQRVGMAGRTVLEFSGFETLKRYPP
jgi:hypothetical protein